MASAAATLARIPNSIQTTDLKNTEDCVFIITHFHMGIGKMRQIKNLKVETDADKSKLRHQKQLMDSPELAEIASQDGFLKRYLDSRTCRYSESMGFLPRAFLVDVDRAIIAYQTVRRPKLVANFMKVYRELEAQNFAPLRDALGEHFSRGDYPPADEVEAGFTFTFAYKPVGDLRGLEGISDVIIAREAEKEREVRMQAVVEWRDAMRATVLGMVEHLSQVLKPEAGKRKVLRDAVLVNLQEFVDTYNVRDLANDVPYQKHINTLRQIMAGVTIDKLRENETLKEAVAAKLDSLGKDMGALVHVSGRKFR